MTDETKQRIADDIRNGKCSVCGGDFLGGALWVNHIHEPPKAPKCNPWDDLPSWDW